LRLFDQEIDRAELARRVGDLAQVAGIRRLALREANGGIVGGYDIRTGGGLRYSVLADRSMDIGELEFKGVPLSWQGLPEFPGPAAADPRADAGRGFSRIFTGLLVTCGLDHIRQPEAEGDLQFPLHGHLPVTPAESCAHGTRWRDDECVFWCEGVLHQRRPSGVHLKLERRIETVLAGRSITLRDTVSNLGEAPLPVMVLYHVNLGWPLLAPGTILMLPEGCDPDARVLGGLPCAKDVAHTSQFTPTPDEEDRFSAALWNPALAGGMGIAVSACANELPHLQVWRQPQPGVNVLALEPCTHPRRSRQELAAAGLTKPLAPGRARTLQLTISIYDDLAELHALYGGRLRSHLLTGGPQAAATPSVESSGRACYPERPTGARLRNVRRHATFGVDHG